MVAAKLTYTLQRAIYRAGNWWALKQGIEITEIEYQAAVWKKARRIIVIRQSASDRESPGKSLSLFADDPAAKRWRYSAYVTDLALPTVEVWRTCRGRADAESRIKGVKADFGLDAFNMKKFWATEADLSFAMPAYNLMSLFRQAVMKTRVKHTLSTLHGMILAVGGSWKGGNGKNHLLLSLPRKKQAWFSGLWANSLRPTMRRNLILQIL